MEQSPDGDRAWPIVFRGGSDGKESGCNAGNPGSAPGYQEDPLEKGMATYACFLAWRILWTEDPGGLQRLGSQSDPTELLTASSSM